jgi:hypothetical protein
VADAVVKERKEAESLRELREAGISVGGAAGSSGDHLAQAAASSSTSFDGSAALPPWLRPDAAPVVPPTSSRRAPKASAAATAKKPSVAAPANVVPPVVPELSRKSSASVVSACGGGGGSKRKAPPASTIVLSTVPGPHGGRPSVAADSASMVSGRSGKSRVAASVADGGLAGPSNPTGHEPALVIEDLMAGIGDKRAVNGVAKKTNPTLSAFPNSPHLGLASLSFVPSGSTRRCESLL